MRRGLPLLLLLLVAGCDIETTGPSGLDLLPPPPVNHAVVSVTRELPGLGEDDRLIPGMAYFFPLLQPSVLPDIRYTDEHNLTLAALHVVMPNTAQSGIFNTGEGGVTLQFQGPDGRQFVPAGSCRISVLSPLNEAGFGRLVAQTDCPVQGDGVELRVLVKFDLSRG
jgi:hypothetical protein